MSEYDNNYSLDDDDEKEQKRGIGGSGVPSFVAGEAEKKDNNKKSSNAENSSDNTRTRAGSSSTISTSRPLFARGEDQILGIDRDFQAFSPRKTLRRGDSRQQYEEFLEDLADKIEHYGKADTPQKQQDLFEITSDYLKYNRLCQRNFKFSCKKLDFKNIANYENADVIAKAKLDYDNKIKKSNMEESKINILSQFAAIGVMSAIPLALSGFAIPVLLGSIAAGVVIGQGSALISKAIDAVKKLRVEAKAKKLATAEPKKKVKEAKKDLRNLKSQVRKLWGKRIIDFLKAGSKKERQAVKMEYGEKIFMSKASIRGRKLALSQAEKEVETRIANLPNYEDFAHKEYLGQSPLESMVEDSIRKSNEKLGIKNSGFEQTQKNEHSSQANANEKAKNTENSKYRERIKSPFSAKPSKLTPAVKRSSSPARERKGIRK